MIVDIAINKPTTLELIDKIEEEFKPHWGDREAYQDILLKYTKLIKDDPFCHSIYKHRGHRYLSISNFDYSEADFSMCLRLYDKHWQAWHYLGFIHYCRGEYEEAVKCYDGAMSCAVPDGIYRSCIIYWQYLCLARGGWADTQKAKDLLALVEPDTPNLLRAYQDQILLFKGVYTIENLEENIKNAELAKTIPGDHYSMAMYYLFQGDNETAKKYLELVMPDEVWYAVAYIAAEQDLKKLS